MPSVVALLVANAFPIVGVLFLGWTVFPLVLLYWLENVIVGGFNVARMLLAQPRNPVSWAGKFFVIPFFIVHFGGFTYMHGVLLLAFFGPKSLEPFSVLHAVPSVIRANHLGWGVASLIASHGFSFVWNYLRSGEYQRASLTALMGQPYNRIIVLHLTVLFGGWVVMLLGSPIGALIVLIALKTAADYRGHTAERQRFAAAAPAPQPSTARA
ncbi:MAG TPA: DUF6498-containing protein [Gemmatimonadales bacterium]|jgi:hypothetical protein|nr:DUF6498-containing protein [Gemmatimonadales bacterium]